MQILRDDRALFASAAIVAMAYLLNSAPAHAQTLSEAKSAGGAPVSHKSAGKDPDSEQPPTSKPSDDKDKDDEEDDDDDDDDKKTAPPKPGPKPAAPPANAAQAVDAPIATNPVPPAAGPATIRLSKARREAAALAFEDKQFLRAWRIAPTVYPELQGLAGPDISVDTAFRSRSGDAESSPASGFGSLIALTMNGSRDTYGVQADILALHSPRTIGDVLVPTGKIRLINPTTTLDAIEPSFFWRRENDYSPSIEIGSTPVGGVLTPTFEAKAAITIPIIEGLEAPLELYRTSVSDSILSYGGSHDPASGRAFGRITESGIKIKVDYTFAANWLLSVTEIGGIRRGREVSDNFHEEAEVSLSYDLKLPGFSTFAIGPQYNFEHFDHDEESLQIGSGGYYSPSSLHRVSFELNFTTLEARRWIVSGDIAPGVQREHEFGKPVSNGGSVNSDLAASYRLTDHAAIGALLHADSSQQFGDYYIGVGLKFSLAPRTVVLSSDLPKSPFD